METIKYIVMIDVTMTTAAGVSDTLQLELYGINHAHIEFVPSGGSEDIATVLLSGPYAKIDDLLIEFTPLCVPEHPFYVRWINRDGGYDYKMFEARSRFMRSSSINETFTPFRYSTPDARGSQERFTYEAKEEQEVGASGIDYEEFMWVSAIQYSPKIEVFDPNLGIWKIITIEGTSSGEWDSGGQFTTFEIKFRLPNPNTQN